MILLRGARLVLRRNKRVEHRHDEERKYRAHGHAGNQHHADAIAGSGSRPRSQHQREMPEDGGRRGHQHRPQPRQRRLAQRGSLRETASLQRVGEFHDEDAVLRDQSDQRNQPDLGIDVDRGQVQEAEYQRAGNRERNRADQDDQRVSKALELRRKHQIDEHDREPERDNERRSLVTDLP